MMMSWRKMLAEFCTEFWGFLKTRKVWWLAPIMIVLFVLGLILFLGSGTAVAPFVYTLF